jgi:ketosteroid isomerase-like protein
MSLRTFPGVIAVALSACATAGGGSGGAKSTEGLHEVRSVSVSIRRSPREVYAFISNGENIPRWAAGLGTTVRRAGDEWLASGSIDSVRVRFTAPNDLGVADHDVTLPSGVTVHNPMRVVPNGVGSTVIFTLLRQPGVSEQQFEEDAQAVARDLGTLKAMLERGDPTSAVPHQASSPSFRSAVEAHVAAVARRDMDALLPTLTTGNDLVMIAPNGFKFHTRQQYIDFHRQWFATNDAGKLDPEIIHLIESPSLGHALIRYRYTSKDSTGTAQGMVSWLALTFALEQGAWRLVFDQNTAIEAG